MLGGFRRPVGGPLTWLGAVAIPAGAAIYFRGAWEFAARGWYTPAPIAPTKFLVTTALHRYVRHPMYIGVFGVLRGEAATFRAVIATINGHLANICFLKERRRGRRGNAIAR